MTPVSVRIRYYCLSHLYPRGKCAAQLLCGHQAVWLMKEACLLLLSLSDVFPLGQRARHN